MLHFRRITRSHFMITSLPLLASDNYCFLRNDVRTMRAKLLPAQELGSLTDVPPLVCYGFRRNCAHKQIYFFAHRVTFCYKNLKKRNWRINMPRARHVTTPSNRKAIIFFIMGVDPKRHDACRSSPIDNLV